VETNIPLVARAVEDVRQSASRVVPFEHEDSLPGGLGQRGCSAKPPTPEPITIASYGAEARNCLYGVPT
jgi:hypothetical protein